MILLHNFYPLRGSEMQTCFHECCIIMCNKSYMILKIILQIKFDEDNYESS